MPAVSLAQNRYVHAAAARGEKWAIKWLREQRGRKVPRVERVGKRGPGRPKEPIDKISNDALWKRAQRADNRPPNKGMVRHHLDHRYGRKSSRVEYISRASHNRRHRSAEVKALLKARAAA